MSTAKRDDEADEEASVYKHLSAEDPFGVAIRSAVYIEHQLERFIDEQTRSKAAVKRLRLDYAGKADLALVLGLSERLRAPIAAIGTIRNDFAHTLEAELSPANADAVYKSMSADDKAIVQRVYAGILKANAATRGLPPKFAALEPLEKFQILVIALRVGFKIMLRDFMILRCVW